MNDTQRALIVVDVQKDFCPGGSLATDKGAEVAAAITAHLRSQGDRDGGSSYDVVVGTKDWHIDPAGHFAPEGTEPDFQETWPVHCVVGSPGAEVHEGLDTSLIDAWFLKGSTPRPTPVSRGTWRVPTAPMAPTAQTALMAPLTSLPCWRTGCAPGGSVRWRCAVSPRTSVCAPQRWTRWPKGSRWSCSASCVPRCLSPGRRWRSTRWRLSGSRCAERDRFRGYEPCRHSH